MLENSKLVVWEVSEDLEALGFEVEGQRRIGYDKFFSDEFARKCICHDRLEVGRYEDDLVVKYDNKKERFILETTWSNLEVTDELFIAIKGAKEVINKGNEILAQYK